ncbi:MAG: hypothetical protein JO269_02835 [Burkholderiaceae bacterium]|nr:hypothetical protein [Burkholderiaceae bacterium]
MNASQLQLDLDEAETGMKLAAAILDSHGGTLLPAGVELTDAMLTSLRRRGVDMISVVNERVSEADLAAERERVQQSLTRLFRRCGERGASSALRQSILRYRLGGAA